MNLSVLIILFIVSLNLVVSTRAPLNDRIKRAILRRILKQRAIMMVKMTSFGVTVVPSLWMINLMWQGSYTRQELEDYLSKRLQRIPRTPYS